MEDTAVKSGNARDTIAGPASLVMYFAISTIPMPLATPCRKKVAVKSSGDGLVLYQRKRAAEATMASKTARSMVSADEIRWDNPMKGASLITINRSTRPIPAMVPPAPIYKKLKYVLCDREGPMKKNALISKATYFLSRIRSLYPLFVFCFWDFTSFSGFSGFNDAESPFEKRLLLCFKLIPMSNAVNKKNMANIGKIDSNPKGSATAPATPIPKANPTAPHFLAAPKG